MDDGVAFAIGNHGYIGGGKDGTISYNTFWEYDTASDSWTSIASFPIALSPTGNSRAFVIDSAAYVCTGTVNNIDAHTLPTGYAYDTVSKAWSAYTNMGVNGIERGYSIAFNIGIYGYICTGKDSLGNILDDLWQWGPNITTGINIPQSVGSTMVYPNPGNGILNFEFSGKFQNGELQITDLTGRIIDTHKLPEPHGKLTINESSLSDGIYFYKIFDSDKLLSSGKFVIAE